MSKMFRYVLFALTIFFGLSATAGAFAQPPRYYRRPPYRRRFHRPYYRHYHHRPYYRHHYRR